MDIDDKQQEAIDYVKNNKRVFIDFVLNQFEGYEVDFPVAVFMAGVPGAGKTEVAKNLLEVFDHVPVRIDADEFRSLIPGYNGTNSNVVQSAASIAVDKTMDAVIERNIPFILDGTFAVGKAKVNIKRAYRHDYDTQIFFVYQDPEAAWKFTKQREKNEGRHVPKEAFIKAYFDSRNNVKKVMDELGDHVTLHVIIKNYTTLEHKIHSNVTDIDKVLPKPYNEIELEGLLSND